MLRKRLLSLILAVLSFIMSVQPVYAFDFEDIFGKKEEIVEEVKEPKLKMYLPTTVAEPVGGVTAARLTVNGGAKTAAALLYDHDTNTVADFEKDTEVILDMGRTILLSQIRYYAGAVDKDGNNCLGTRFYASNDKKNFVELGVVEGDVAPENNWYDITFSGYGEYRYFKAEIPEKSNICEIEWLEATGFLRTSAGGGLYNIRLNLCGFDALEDIEASVLAAVYNDKGVLKQVALTEQIFPKDTAVNFSVELGRIEAKNGDSYRIIVFGEDGSQPIPNPLNYRINGASADFKISSIFSDNMILQADKPTVVWGKAPRYREVEVSLENYLGGGVTKTVTADENSEWKVDLGTFSAGGAYSMTIKCDGITYRYNEITFGDVWLCTGQSNMEFYMVAGEDSAKELKNSKEMENDNIRLLNMFNKGIDGAAAPVDNPSLGESTWQKMDADVASYCSQVGYYFAKEIQKTTGEPVGIINVAVGDTEINRWIQKGMICGSFASTDGDLYNNRIKPFENLAIKGILLYQGEADQYRTHLTATEYSDAMAGLVDAYREIWGEELPFYWAQLTRYRVDESIVRDGQRIALSKVKNPKNTGMIVLNDIVGNYKGGKGSCRDDIHPWDKKTVAERFVAYAKRDCYGQNVAVSGPVYKSSERIGNSLVLTFECDGKLRVMPKERYADKETDKKIKKEKINVSKPQEFEVAGADGEFYKADARLEGKTVVLTCDKVKEPVYARYAWGAYPEMPNLTDDSHLPAATFSTKTE